MVIQKKPWDGLPRQVRQQDSLGRARLSPARRPLSGSRLRRAEDSRALPCRRLRAVWCIAFAFSFLNISLAAPTNAIPASGSFRTGYRSDRILVKPKPGVRWEAMARLHAAHTNEVLQTFSNLDQLQVVRLPQRANVRNVLQRYQESGLVEFAEPDYWIHAALEPNDPEFQNGVQWALRNTGRNWGITNADIRAPAGWDILNSATNVIVAVIDSGVRYTHEDLADNMWVNPGEIAGNGIDDDKDGYVDDIHGINAIVHSGDPDDDSGHGTHVAGIIGAIGNNGKGTAGVVWHVQIMACKFLDDTGNGTLSDAITCIDYARAKGAKIINASWGEEEYSSSLRLAIQRARDAGIIVVAAAGNAANNNDVTPYYPANYDVDNIVSVAATTAFDELATFSNYGVTTVDLGAPGWSIYSTLNSSDNAYGFYSGSSMAAPFVSGTLVLLRARFPQSTYAQLIERVLQGTDPLPGLTGKCVTGGRLNLKKALGPDLIADFLAVPLTGPLPLTVNFTNTSVGQAGNCAWQFDDGSPDSAEANPRHVFDSEGNFNVTLSIAGTNGTVDAKSRQISVVANYQVIGTNFNWIDPTNMPTISLSDNGVSPAQALPFVCQFYGQSYDQLYVGANGLMGFQSQGLEASSNLDLPSLSPPHALLCPYWDNLNPASHGSVRIGTDGTAPNRRFVVSWLGVPQNASSATALTFQAVLAEDSPHILFQYLEVYPNDSRAGGRRATVGIENETGVVAAQYTFDGSPALLTNRQALLFVSTSAGGLSVSPVSNQSITGNIGGPFPPGMVNFAVKNTGRDLTRWTVGHAQNWLTLSISNGILPGDQSTSLLATINENATGLPSGSYRDTLVFVNPSNGRGNTTRSVNLVINGTQGILTVTPEPGWSSSGFVGGPFGPSSQVYTLINSGSAALDWTLGKGQAWISALSTSGSLAGGESTTVLVTINTNANILDPGVYTDSLAFSNASDGQGNTHRDVSLSVRPLPTATLQAPTLLSNGQFRLWLIGSSDQPYTLEASTNLAFWQPIQTNTASAEGPLEFIDPAAGTFFQRFYRAVFSPELPASIPPVP